MRKRRKRIRRFIALLLAFLILVSLAGGLFYGLFRLGSVIFFNKKQVVENEKEFLSPPNEEILFVRPQSGIFISDMHGRTIQQLTSANDLAPSWNQDGTGFYFLRKSPTDDLHLMFYNFLQGQLSESSKQSFSLIEIPNPEDDIIKISPDGAFVAVSSYDWGLQIIEVATKKPVPGSFGQCWEYWDIFSRNSKFCLIATRPHHQDLNFISGFEKPLKKPSLYFATTDLKEFQMVDSSVRPFQGMSFSRNGYTFAYAKDGHIYYVDTIQQIAPVRVTEGILPAIRPVTDARKYKLIRPFWADFDVSNLVDMLSFEQSQDQYLVWATPNYLALVDVAKKTLEHYAGHRKNAHRLGWKLMDFFATDTNNNGKKEILASWWSGGNSEGAERISIFSLDFSTSKIIEIFQSQKRFHNTLQMTDLNGDGLKDLLNKYSDVSGAGNMALDALIWTDVYTWDGSSYQLNNERFAHIYLELAESYRSFLLKALRNPDHYGSDLFLIRELLERADAIIEQAKMR